MQTQFLRSSVWSAGLAVVSTVFFSCLALGQEAPPESSAPAASGEISVPATATPPPPVQALSPTLPAGFNVGAALDLFAPLPMQNAEGDQERFRIRSGQLYFAAKLDSAFDALLNVGGRDVNGELKVTVHEGYLKSSTLLPFSRIKLGKFLLGAGHLNQIRQQDWPFPSAPKSHKQFFSDSNASDTGVEYALVPGNGCFELVAGVTNGYTYGYSTNNSGSKPLTPTHYLHPTFFSSWESGGDLQAGLTYLGRIADDGTVTRLSGFDLTYALHEGPWLKWLLQTEAYYRFTQLPGLPLVEEIGGYLYAQRGLSEKWSAGLRLDAFTTPSLRTFEGDKRSNLDAALVPVLAYKASEASTVRLAYTYFRESLAGNSDRTVQLLELQLVAELGSQPSYRD